MKIKLIIGGFFLIWMSGWDLSGSVVSCIQQGVMPAGENCTVWNGCSQSGFPVSGGVYLIRIESMGQIVTGRLVVLR
ncbi:MAG: hypothetical protein KAH54_08075 [Candidatus Sabulitectum sp.]|nr:hypothetical protein [Candidatus Sabulitectum sp.]